ncbi:hypothetical protein PV367_12245 [Streptomyces europaeiscabiei]|uniref:Uncharacterized protein n=1 Tax=Streptomyces europaeiscabiei TaxID=146819 RepID=A0AAJ2PND3_9ACTN|nr:hypothetical protein [Streptomyces europaeiscabiei]MDX3130549.1 hypothetical protein [Streptomyces europaeiscabiei]
MRGVRTELAVAAGATGLAVGVVGGAAVEVVDEAGDFFEGEEEEEGQAEG